MTADAPTRHVPMRQCRVCRNRRPQSELVRLGIPGKPGRGAYGCGDNPRCVEILPKTLAITASKKKRLN